MRLAVGLADRGSLWNDAVLLGRGASQRRRSAALAEVAELAEALAGGRERHQEPLLQGSAFLTPRSAWPEVALPAFAGGKRPIRGGRRGFRRAWRGLGRRNRRLSPGQLANQTSVAIRCGLIGQVQAVALLARLEHEVEEIADRAANVLAGGRWARRPLLRTLP